MTTEQRPERAMPSDAADEREREAQPTSRRVAYKSVLTAVVIGLITISGLWLFVLRQEGGAFTAVSVPEPVVQTQATTESPGAEVDRTEGHYDQIDRRLTALSGRIDRGFEMQLSHNSEVKRSLTTLVESVRAIKAAVTDISESNNALSQRIDEAISRLDTVIKDVRQRGVAQRIPTAKPRPGPARTPPFRVDAIDVWDDVNYVAVSQAGRVAFLKAGEQQSGWTVTRIDRLQGQVEFQGPAGQVHSVLIER